MKINNADIIEDICGEAFYEGNVNRMSAIQIHELLNRCMDEAAKQGRTAGAKDALMGLSNLGCFISEDNAGYAHFVKGSGINKGMGSEGLANHLLSTIDEHPLTKLVDSRT